MISNDIQVLPMQLMIISATSWFKEVLTSNSFGPAQRYGGFGAQVPPAIIIIRNVAVQCRDSTILQNVEPS